MYLEDSEALGVQLNSAALLSEGLAAGHTHSSTDYKADTWLCTLIEVSGVAPRNRLLPAERKGKGC